MSMAFYELGCVVMYEFQYDGAVLPNSAYLKRETWATCPPLSGVARGGG